MPGGAPRGHPDDVKTLFKWAFRAFLLLIVLLVAAVLLFDTAVRAGRVPHSR